MGLWCEMKTSRGVSVRTHGRGMLGTSVSSTATAPCTETHFRSGVCSLFHPGRMLVFSAGIDLPH